MYKFKTNIEAKEFIQDRVDNPTAETIRRLARGAILSSSSQGLTDGTFTNIYDLSFPSDGATKPLISLGKNTFNIFNHVKSNTDILASISGGFFFLADKCSKNPLCPSLNLAISDTSVDSLPVVDREAIVLWDDKIEFRHIKSLGLLAINDAEMTWSGSLTKYDTDCKVFSNGNSEIEHMTSLDTGSIRVLDDSSRYTPKIEPGENVVDLGIMSEEGINFTCATINYSGCTDIFDYNFVIRTGVCNVESENCPRVKINTIDTLNMNDSRIQGAVSVGPSLESADFNTHLINSDLSLGSKPPFIERPLARLALYETESGIVHAKLFDGRPGSKIFPGVLPEQARDIILSDEDIAWGCFLDPGQTSKIVVRDNLDVTSYGNSHYLKWPDSPEDYFTWSPEEGRPIANSIDFI